MSVVGTAQQPPARSNLAEQELLKPAKTAKLNVDETEARVLQSLEAIEKLTKDSRLGDLKVEGEVIKEFRERLIPSLKKSATELLTKKADFDKNFKLYQDAVKKAPPAFEKAAQQYQKFAETEDDASFKEHYLDMEIIARKVAKDMVDRQGRLDEMHASINDKMKFVEKSVAFLDRLDAFLEIYPDTSKGKEIEDYLKKLDNYVDDFRRAINAFKDFSKSADDPSRQSPGAREPQKIPAAASNAIPQVLQRARLFELVDAHANVASENNRAMERRIDLNVVQFTRKEILREVAKRTGTMVAIDSDGIQNMSEMETPIDFKAKGETVASILDRLLQPVKMQRTEKHGIIVISANAKSSAPKSAIVDAGIAEHRLSGKWGRMAKVAQNNPIVASSK